jgi:transposase InsO family protein
MTTKVREGKTAYYQGQTVMVVEFIGHDVAVVQLANRAQRVSRDELLPILDAEELLSSTDTSGVPEEAWQGACRRAQAIRDVLAMETGRTEALARSAAELGLSERHLYRLASGYKVHQTISGMVPQQRGRKPGSCVLDLAVERIIAEKIDSYYLVKERTTAKALYERIAAACREEKLPPPAQATVRRRLRGYESRSHQVRRLGSKKAKYLYQAMPGHVDVSAPLERVEIDHTPLDVMARSDDPLCDYVARPWLTIAIDVYSRCVLGIHIGFDAPSILSVALCLTHAVLEKTPSSEFGVPLPWPMYGLPKQIVVDNGKDFVSAAFRRGCEEHGIILSYRPIGSPHYGGTIERLIGTMVGQCHLLPGTTKNSTRARGEYNSAKHAALTLSECRRWFVEQLLGRYHLREHRMLRIPPQVAWEKAKGGDLASS